MRRGSLGIGLALCAAGVLFALAPSAGAAIGWLARWWPVALVLLGSGSLVGFASRRVPRSPVRGAAMIVVGALALAVTLQSATNPLALYGRFWPIVLGVMALVEILRFYTYRPEIGERRPALFGTSKLILVGLVVISGLAANRVAEADPNLLARISMPAGLEHLRDELFGEPFRFDPITKTAALPASGVVAISNRFGDVVVDVSDGDQVQVSVIPTVRAYDRAAAARVAADLRLDVVTAGSVVSVGTNREDISHEIGTDLHVVVPRSAGLRVTQSHGKVAVAGLEPAGGTIQIQASHSEVQLERVVANLVVRDANDTVRVLESSGSLDVAGRNDVQVKHFAGAIRVEDADSVSVEGLAGPSVDLVSVDHADVTLEDLRGLNGAPTRVDVQGEHTNVTLRNVVGDVRVRTTHDRVVTEDVTGAVDIEASHAEVAVARVGSLRIVTDHDDVRVQSVAGPVDITNDHGGVDVKDFGGVCEVRTSFDSVAIAAAPAQAGRVTVDNEHGSIVAKLPSNGRYRVVPKAERGHVRVDAAFSSASDDARANEVNLSTSFGDIAVRALAGTSAAGPA
jgi:DUF4097 and DUF4098 domain-containing protein YvlB